MNETAKEEAHAHDEEQVGQNGTKHRGLDNFNLAIFESDNADLCQD